MLSGEKQRIMQKKTIIILLGLFVLQYVAIRPSLHAQEADTVWLQDVAISSQRISEYSQSANLQQIDSLALAQNSESNLSRLLQRFANGNIRSYGNTGLATPGFRGSGSQHTQLLWNGVNLVSSLNGSSDLSLVPALFVDQLDIQYGNSSNLLGSGAIGGSIHLENSRPQKEGLQHSIHLSANDIDKRFIGMKSSFSSPKYATTLRLFYNHDPNNFRFINTYQRDPSEEIREGGDQTQYGVLQENYFTINSRNTARVMFWLQQNELEVVEPVTVSNPLNAIQNDDVARVVAGWKQRGTTYNWEWQSALSYQNTKFEDNSISKSSFLNHNHQFTFHYENWREVLVETGVELIGEHGKSDNYATQHNRNRLALFTAIKYQPSIGNVNMDWTLTLREEWVDGETTPFIPGLALHLQPVAPVTLFLSTSRIFRIPTFNDLYWEGAGARGNPDLNPEKGWSHEAGFTFDQKFGNINLNLSSTLFSSRINNWIQWNDFDGVWEPVNLQDVWARGITISGELNLLLASQTTLSALGGYEYTKSTLEQSRTENQLNIGNQLFYTPLHQANGGIRVKYKKWALLYHHRYVGSQYTDMDNNPFNKIDDFLTGDIQLSYEWLWFGLTSQAGLIVQNLWNENYEVRRGYPLPLRNTTLNLKFLF
jgi:iron complex outermembrane receptor protein